MKFYQKNYIDSNVYEKQSVDKLSANTYGVIALDSVAALYCLNMTDDIEQSIFAKESNVKRFIHFIRTGYTRLKVELAKRMDGKIREHTLSDFGNIVYGVVENDILKLQYSIANCLAKEGLGYSMLRAKILTGLALADLACSFVTEQEKIKFIRLDDQHVLDVKRVLRPLKITTIQFGAKRLKDIICEGKNIPTVNLNEDPNCRIASKIIINKLGNSNILKTALDRAAKINNYEERN